jgi:1-acyl-sn-glycerol-3-phosphate acyltransferase
MIGPVTDDVGKLYPVAKRVITPVFRASWRFTVEGLENVPTDGPAVLCPNHTSVLDSFFIPAMLPRRVTYVGKAEYMDDWKTRKLFPALGMIPIDRTGGDAGERALATAQRILENGELFGIYPEGTRSRDGRLYRGHTGPARLAMRAGAPIIPIGLVGARDVMPPDARFPKLRRPVRVRFGRPIDVERYRDREDDHLVYRQIIDEVMYEIRELSGQEYVNEYATKKKKAPAPEPVRDTAPTGGRPDLVVVASNGKGMAPANGNGNGDHGRVERLETPDRGDEGIESEMVAATSRSSADLLSRPVRRTS